MVRFCADYLAAGGNRHPSAADWDHSSGLLAYGADQNIALWSPLDERSVGVIALLSGHTKIVTVVRFFPIGSEHGSCILLSGSADTTIRIWRAEPKTTEFVTIARLLTHSATINCIEICPGLSLIASGSADSRIRIGRLKNLEGDVQIENLQSIQTNPPIFPLCLAFHIFEATQDVVLAAAGTNSSIQVYCAGEGDDFKCNAILTGHQAWIRALTFKYERACSDSDLLLASASQDKYIRLWRIKQDGSNCKGQKFESVRLLNSLLSNKAQSIRGSRMQYSITFEALLVGHEDWVYSISWQPGPGRLSLLSASADNSLAIWHSDENSGVWYPTIRLGEISLQKGSTTATGSAGGLWIGLWSLDGNNLVGLSKTGSWRMWSRTEKGEPWRQTFATSGHTKSVSGIAWSKKGSYLLSTSLDQTTRLHSEWYHENNSRSWHEIGRPQIHGYDLNCIDSIDQTHFVSGADEKLLRVFQMPWETSETLEKFCRVGAIVQKELPDSAAIPVLGLSNKEVNDRERTKIRAPPVLTDELGVARFKAHDKLIASELYPPYEDRLARHTLWPESEKLYGHGYEISSVAASHDASIIATACKASALDHAVIRLYTTKEWREIRPPLKFHSSTVHDLSFSKDDLYLLSIGKDRQWAVFERCDTRADGYTQKFVNHQAHKRQIHAASWAPLEAGRIFMTASRDTYVKVWRIHADTVENTNIIYTNSAATTLDIAPVLISGDLMVCIGLETGEIRFELLDRGGLKVKRGYTLDNSLMPALCINQVAWRPVGTCFEDSQKLHVTSKPTMQLAVAGRDCSVRLFSLLGLFEK